MSEQLERNKQAAKAVYDLAFNQNQPRQAVERYVGAVYIQHNPGVADGKDAFVAYFEKMAKEYPGKRVHFKRVIDPADSALNMAEYLPSMPMWTVPGTTYVRTPRAISST